MKRVRVWRLEEAHSPVRWFGPSRRRNGIVPLSDLAWRIGSLEAGRASRRGMGSSQKWQLCQTGLEEPANLCPKVSQVRTIVRLGAVKGLQTGWGICPLAQR